MAWPVDRVQDRRGLPVNVWERVSAGAAGYMNYRWERLIRQRKALGRKKTTVFSPIFRVSQYGNSRDQNLRLILPVNRAGACGVKRTDQFFSLVRLSTFRPSRNLGWS